jgi:hypothetical protein
MVVVEPRSSVAGAEIERLGRAGCTDHAPGAQVMGIDRLGARITHLVRL